MAGLANPQPRDNSREPRCFPPAVLPASVRFAASDFPRIRTPARAHAEPAHWLWPKPVRDCRSSRLIEIDAPCRCAWRRLGRQAQMREHALDQRGRFDRSDDLQLAATRATLNIDVEHPPEQARPTHARRGAMRMVTIGRVRRLRRRRRAGRRRQRSRAACASGTRRFLMPQHRLARRRLAAARVCTPIPFRAKRTNHGSAAAQPDTRIKWQIEVNGRDGKNVEDQMCLDVPARCDGGDVPGCACPMRRRSRRCTTKPGPFCRKVADWSGEVYVPRDLHGYSCIKIDTQSPGWGGPGRRRALGCLVGWPTDRVPVSSSTAAGCGLFPRRSAP